jgi:hypothetical protein
MSSATQQVTPAGSLPGEQFRFGSEFASPNLERRYRESQLDNQKLTARWCILAVAIGGFIFATSDYRLFGWSTQLYILWFLRVETLGLSLVTLLILRKVDSPKLFDAILCAWGVFVSCATAYVNSTRTNGYTGHIIVTIEVVLLTYCVLPLPLRLQIAIASINTIAGPLLQTWSGPREQGMTALAVLQSYLVANLMGMATGIQLQRRSRQLFAAALEQKALTEHLEQALADIRTLHGILPICAHCKRVLNDAGHWEQVEVYVRKHTHAQFTHDICPECARHHFGADGES